MQKEKWPYIQISKNDVEQKKIKKEIEDCCVAFIDILGFKEMVSSDIDRVIVALRYIEAFCDSFYSFPARDTDRIVPTSYTSGYDSAYSANYEDDIEYEMNKPTATMFSDSIVISQPMNEYFDISEFIEFISKMQYQLLLEGVLIRGGVSVGNLYHRRGYIFGDGMVSAYNLESTVAQYPRIIISPDIIRKYDDFVMKKFEADHKQYIRYGKEKIYLPSVNDYEYEYSPYIKTDFDQQYFIDYLQDNLEQIKAGESGLIDVSIQLLKEFYEWQYSIIVGYITEGLKNCDSNVHKKYEWLKKYFNRTIKLCLNTYIGQLADGVAEKTFFDYWLKLYIE